MDKQTIVDYIYNSPHNTNKSILNQMLEEYEDSGAYCPNLLISVNSPKGSPSDPNNYELMVSENGVDWMGVPGTKQFAGDIPLGSETHLIKYKDYYIFTSGADNGSPYAKYDILFAYTKDFVSFYHIYADFSIPKILQPNQQVANQGRWAPCLVEDKEGRLWVTISVQVPQTIQPKYSAMSGMMFQQYIFQVDFDFFSKKVTRVGDFIKLKFSKDYANIIDGTIFWSDKENKYVCVFKDNYECVVNIGISDAITGPYEVIKEDLFDTPFTESGCVCELNGSYLYTCVCHYNVISPLCSYVATGDTLGKIGTIREMKYNGELLNLNGSDNTFLRTRMVFPIKADKTLRDLISKTGLIIVNNLPERNCQVVQPKSILGVRNTFTALPNICYDLQDLSNVEINFTNTAKCKNIILRGNVPCRVKINGYEVIQNRPYWRQEYLWDGQLWRVSGYVQPYGILNYENDYIDGIKIGIKDHNILMFSGLPEFKVDLAKNTTQVIGSSESLGDSSYTINYRVRIRGAYLVVYQGAIIGQLCVTVGSKDNILFKAFVDIEKGTIGELCCPPMVWNI